MPTSFYENIPDILLAIRNEKPKTVLDVGFGRGKYGFLINEYFPEIEVDGVEVFNDYVQPIHRHIYNKIYREDIFEMDIPEYSMYLLVDVLEHWDKDKGRELLDKMTKMGKVLISTPKNPGVQGASHGNEWERHISKWELSDFSNYKFKQYQNGVSLIYLLWK